MEVKKSKTRRHRNSFSRFKEHNYTQWQDVGSAVAANIQLYFIRSQNIESVFPGYCKVLEYFASCLVITWERHRSQSKMNLDLELLKNSK